MPQDEITETLALLEPDELYPAWKWIDLMERHGVIDVNDSFPSYCLTLRLNPATRTLPHRESNQPVAANLS